MPGNGLFMADSFRSGRWGTASVLDAVAAGVGAEDLEALAPLADGLQGTADRLVLGVPLDVEEEQVRRVAVQGRVGGGERLDPGHVDAVLLERVDGLAQRPGLVGQ